MDKFALDLEVPGARASRSGRRGRRRISTSLLKRSRSTIIDRWRHLQPPRIDDFVVVLSPDGQELKKVSVLDALVASPYARVLITVAWYSKDDYAPQLGGARWTSRPRWPPAAGRQVLVSMADGAIGGDLDRGFHLGGARALDLVSMIPICCRTATCCCSTTSVTSAMPANSRVIEFNPKTYEIVWSYGDAESALSKHPPFGSGAACEWQHADDRIGRWPPARGDSEWRDQCRSRHPIRGGDADEFIPIVAWGQRIQSGRLAPEFLDSPTS